MNEKLAKELADKIFEDFKDEEIELEEKDIQLIIKSCHEVLDKRKKSGFKYFEGDMLPNDMRILASTFFTKNDPRYSVECKDKKVIVMTEEEVDNVMNEYYKSK